MRPELAIFITSTCSRLSGSNILLGCGFNMSKELLVSVIIPNYNGAAYVRDAIRSVQEQTFSCFEAFIIDDASLDDSISIIEDSIKGDERFHLVRLKGNSGAARCRNAGIERSRGRFIAFLDADDLWLRSKLETQINIMRDKGVAISCSAANVINERGEKIGVRIPPEKITYSILLKRTPMVTSTVVYDTEKVGRLLMPDIVRRQDLALWLKVIRLGGDAFGITESLACYRVHGASLSRNKRVSALYTWKVMRDVEGISLLRSIYYFSFYALKGFWGRLRRTN